MEKTYVLNNYYSGNDDIPFYQFKFEDKKSAKARLMDMVLQNIKFIDGPIKLYFNKKKTYCKITLNSPLPNTILKYWISRESL